MPKLESLICGKKTFVIGKSKLLQPFGLDTPKLIKILYIFIKKVYFPPNLFQVLVFHIVLQNMK